MSVRSPNSIDWPDNPLDEQEFVFDGVGYIYNEQKNKWTIQPGATITKSAIVDAGINFVNLEDYVTAFESSSPLQIFYDDAVQNSAPFANLMGWRKISFPKSLTDGNDTIYIRAGLFSAGYVQLGQTVNSPNVKTYITAYEPDNTNASNSTANPLLKFQTGALADNFVVQTIPQSPYTDTIEYVFIKVFEDPDNSNNFAIWHDIFRASQEARVQYNIAGYLDTSASVDITGLFAGVRGSSGVSTGTTQPTLAKNGDLWYHLQPDGSYITKVYNETTGLWEENCLGLNYCLNTSTADSGDVLSWNGSDYEWVESYDDNDVDTHLNISTANNNEVLSWNGSDYEWVEINNLNPGQRGEVFYYTTDGTSEHISATIADVGRYVTEENVSESTTAGARAEEIFNNWYRFSHNSTNTYPASAGDLSAWDYDENTGIIECTANTGTYVGFVSDDVATDYTHNVTLSSSGSDNDTVAVIIGYVTEGLLGQADYREYTLSAITNTGGTPPSIGWGIYYNYLQSDQQEIASINISPSGGWSGKTLRVEISKTGSAISAVVSDFNSGTVNEDYRISFNCNDFGILNKFAGDVKYGYAAYSQDRATFYDAVLTGFTPSAVYDMDNGVGYLYNPSSGNFDLDSTLFNQLKLNNPGRFLIDQDTKKLYYIDQSANLYPITTTSGGGSSSNRSLLNFGHRDTITGGGPSSRTVLRGPGNSDGLYQAHRAGTITKITASVNVTSLGSSPTTASFAIEKNGTAVSFSSISGITSTGLSYLATGTLSVSYNASDRITASAFMLNNSSGDNWNISIELTEV